MASENDQPAVPNYPTDAHSSELEQATSFIKEALSGSGEWQDQGERDGVKLSRRLNPTDAYAVPTVKGTTLVEGATTDDLVSVIQLPGLRLLWDSRFQRGFMLRRFNRRTFSFYTEMKGMGWLVYPRTIAGVQQQQRTSEDYNHEILVIQTSIQDDELAPAEDYKVRANLTAAGWLLKPVEEGVELTYCVSISLAGGIPATMVSMLATEIPTCAGRVRDTYYSHGFGPYIRLPNKSTDCSTTFQTERYSHTNPEREWTATVTAGSASDGGFEICYDHKRMFPEGIEIELSGGAKEGSKAEDNGSGVITVSFEGSADKKRLDITIRPKDA